MELVNAIVGKILEFTVEPIGRQLGYLISYHSNVKKLKDEYEELHNRREAVQHLVDGARRNGEEIEKEVQDWLAKVDEIVSMTEKFNGEENHANTRCSFKSCPNLWLRHQLSRKASKMAQDVVEIKGKGKFDKVSFYEPPELVGLPSTSSSIINEGMESRLSIINQVLKELADPNINMVGLCGLPGVGKTTLAKAVARKAKDQKLFATIVWVTVAQSPVLKEIQTQIADNVGMKLDIESVQPRASHLERRLKQEKNLLVVLDDLWQRLDFHEVGIPFDFNPEKTIPLPSQNGEDNERRKCKILLTSRIEELLSTQMNCTRVIRVGLMSKDEAWKLFKEKAELPDDFDCTDLITRVFQQCGQLPLVIVVVATTMKNRRSHREWRNALEQMINPLRRSTTGINEVDSSLMLSYKHLNKECQSIFLLCAMLSHDPLITDLLMYIVGLELLQGIHSMEKAQDALDALIGKLKASSLLLDSFSNDHFTMHDVVREFVLSFASKEQHSIVMRHEEHYDFLSENLLEGCFRLCLDKCDITELQELYCPRLEFFLLNSKDSDLKIPSSFFESMTELKVMSVTNIHFLSLPSLSLLKKLRTLCLHSCVLKDITEVQNLKNLTALSLAYSDIEQLPSELALLTSLQMLNLTHCSKLFVVPLNLLSSLKRLETLYMGNSFTGWVAEGSSEVNQNASLGELRHLPRLSSLEVGIPDASVLPKDLFLETSLTRYKISIGESWSWSGKYETSKSLELKLTSCFHLERGVQKLLERVEDLYLGDMRGIKNVLCDLNGEGFMDLKHLHIRYNDQIEYVINSTGLDVAFPILETLDLDSLKGLKKLCQGWIRGSFFHNLKVIRVYNCREVESIFSNLMGRCFAHLVKVEVARCESIKRIVASTNQHDFEQYIDMNVITFNQLQSLKMDDLPTLMDFYFEENAMANKSNNIYKSLFSNKVSFPQLEALDLSSINRLIPSIWDDQLPSNSFNNLKTLIVRGCGFVENLVPLHVLRCLSNLEEVYVIDCDLLEMLFDLNELDNYKETWVVPLKKLTLRRLEKLKHVWSKDPQKMISFSSLQEITVDECYSLTSILPISIATDMAHLEKLEISYCGIDAVVANDHTASESESFRFVFPNMTFLSLKNLRNMRSFYSQRHQIQCPRLQELIIITCNKLKMFQEEISNSASLQEEEALGTTTHHYFFDAKVIIPQLERLRLDDIQLFLIMREALQYGLFRSFPNLKQLKVGGRRNQVWITDVLLCKELFGIHVAQFSPLQTLTLFEVKKVKHIWNMSSPQHILQNLVNLEVFYSKDLINLGPSFIPLGNLTSIHVVGCHGLIYLLTSSTASRLVHLRELKIEHCRSIKEIITKKTEDAAEDIVFNKLAYLKLHKLPSLERFCGHSFTFSFPSLNEVIIGDCGRLSTFCPGGVVQTSLLNGVTFGYKKVELETNLETTVQLHFLQQVRHLELDQYPEIRKRWNEKLPPHISFRSLWLLEVKNCDTLSEFVIPSHLVRSLSNMEVLDVSNCNSVRTVFDLQGINMDEEAVNDDEESQKLLPQAMVELRYLMLRNLPNLNSVWNKDPAGGVICFPNLKEVNACECGSLRYIFPASVAKGLVQLEKLVVESCGLLEVIVGGDDTSETSPPTFVFPQLLYLKLVKLPNLKGFYPRGYTSEWPQLESLIVSQCKNLAVFVPPMASITSSTEKNNGAETQQPLFSTEEHALNEGLLLHKSFPRLNCLEVDNWELLSEYVIPSHLAISWRNLKKLYVRNCHSVKTVFDLQETDVDNQEIDKGEEKEDVDDQETQKLLLQAMDLEVLMLRNLPNLNYVWNKDPGGIICFQNLAEVCVFECGGLRYIFPTSVANGLTKLEKLVVESCGVEVIVAEDDTSETSPSFVFPRLKYLKLWKLPNLMSFYPRGHKSEWPLLECLIVSQCKNVAVFGPPMASITSSSGEENIGVETQQPLFSAEKHALNEGLLLHKSFPKLNCLEVDNWEMLSEYVIPSHLAISCRNLKKLYVRNCHSVKTVFDLKGINMDKDTDVDDEETDMDDEETDMDVMEIGEYLLRKDVIDETDIDDEEKYMNASETDLEEFLLRIHAIMGKETDMDDEETDLDKETPKLLLHAMDLEELKIINLPNLNYVWNKDPGGIICFQNLTKMHVCECGSLKYIFPASIAKGLGQLRKLVVESCGVEVIVAEDDTSETSPSFVFPRLKYLKLWKLPNLTSFYPQGHKSQWPQLKCLLVSQCQNLAVFGRPMSSITSSSEDNIAVETKQPLFSAEKIIPNLKELMLNEKDVIMISKGQFQVDLFPRVKTLHLESFPDELATFPYSFLERFPKLYKLYVESSSFEEIFPSQTQIVDDMVKVSPLVGLRLNCLNQLKKIWNDDSQLHPIHQDLGALVVERCPNLIKLTPSSSFGNLKYLKVSDCHQLNYIVTDSTAKSLVSLCSLEIIDCKMVEEVVASGNEDLGGIKFNNLLELRLIGLPSLMRFCSQNHTFKFPRLYSTTVIGCLQMKMFCPGILETPSLNKVKIEEDEMRWEGDLNKTIESLLFAKNISNNK